MSRRRYLSTKISTDPKVNALAINSGPMAALLYTWMIPHAEDDGTLTADAQELLYQILPGQRQLVPEDVEGYIEAMVGLGLVMRVNDRLVFPPEKFYRYQTYVSESRRTTAENSALQRTTAQISANQRPGEGEGKGERKTFVKGEVQGYVQGEGERRLVARAPAPGPITEDVISGFVAIYANHLGGEQHVRRAIDKCMNYEGFDRYKDKVARVREWLDDDVERGGGSGRNGTTRNATAGKRVRSGPGPDPGSGGKGGGGDTFAARTADARRRRGEAILAEIERDEVNGLIAAGIGGDPEATGDRPHDQSGNQAEAERARGLAEESA